MTSALKKRWLYKYVIHLTSQVTMQSENCYLYNAVHLVHNTGLLHSGFLDNFTLHYIHCTLYNAFLSNADFSRHKKPRCSRPLCSWKKEILFIVTFFVCYQATLTWIIYVMLSHINYLQLFCRETFLQLTYIVLELLLQEKKSFSLH